MDASVAVLPCDTLLTVAGTLIPLGTLLHVDGCQYGAASRWHSSTCRQLPVVLLLPLLTFSGGIIPEPVANIFYLMEISPDCKSF